VKPLALGLDVLASPFHRVVGIGLSFDDGSSLDVAPTAFTRLQQIQSFVDAPAGGGNLQWLD